MGRAFSPPLASASSCFSFDIAKNPDGNVEAPRRTCIWAIVILALEIIFFLFFIFFVLTE